MKTYLSGIRKAGLMIPVIICTTLIITACSKKNDNYGTGGGGGSGPGPGEVWMQGNTFNPATISIAMNGTVTWVNKDSYSHDVVANDNSFNSGMISAGGTFSHTFNTSGTFGYKCTIHSGMNGQVVVQQY